MPAHNHMRECAWDEVGLVEGAAKAGDRLLHRIPHAAPRCGRRRWQGQIGGPRLPSRSSSALSVLPDSVVEACREQLPGRKSCTAVEPHDFSKGTAGLAAMCGEWGGLCDARGRGPCAPLGARRSALPVRPAAAASPTSPSPPALAPTMWAARRCPSRAWPCPRRMGPCPPPPLPAVGRSSRRRRQPPTNWASQPGLQWRGVGGSGGAAPGGPSMPPPGARRQRRRHQPRTAPTSPAHPTLSLPSCPRSCRHFRLLLLRCECSTPAWVLALALGSPPWCRLPRPALSTHALPFIATASPAPASLIAGAAQPPGDPEHAVRWPAPPGVPR